MTGRVIRITIQRSFREPRTSEVNSWPRTSSRTCTTNQLPRNLPLSVLRCGNYQYLLRGFLTFSVAQPCSAGHRPACVQLRPIRLFALLQLGTSLADLCDAALPFSRNFSGAPRMLSAAVLFVTLAHSSKEHHLTTLYTF